MSGTPKVAWFIEKARRCVSRHIFSNVTKPAAGGDNDEQSNRKMQSQVAFRRKARLEKTNLPREAARYRLTHRLSFTNPTARRAAEAFDRQDIESTTMPIESFALPFLMPFFCSGRVRKKMRH